jgi:hypothetical protein
MLYQPDRLRHIVYWEKHLVEQCYEKRRYLENIMMT